MSNCVRLTNVTKAPISCQPNNTDLTTWTITGYTVTNGNQMLAPTTSAILNPYGGGSPLYYCSPKNATGFTDLNTVLCNGSPFPWISLVKVNGVYGNGLYSGDTVQIYNSPASTFCGPTADDTYINCNVFDQSLASNYTLIFA
jgi:hypothetical protein